jgi:hypothetical protein
MGLRQGVESDGQTASGSGRVLTKTGGWEEEAPTRPVAASTAGSVDSPPDEAKSDPEGARGPVPAMSLEKAAAVLSFEQPPCADTSAPGVASPVSRPPSSAVERWFESIRPPVPSLPEVALERRPDPGPRRWIGWLLVTLMVGACVCIMIAAAVVRVLASGRSPDRFASTAPAPARGVAYVAGTPAAAPAPSDPRTTEAAANAASPSQTPPTTGELQVAPGTASRRMFIDGRPAGDGPKRFQLSCGVHVVSFGTARKPRSVVVPCGGSVTVTP